MAFPPVSRSGAASLLLGVVGVMAVVLAASAGNLAVLAVAVVGGRLLHFEGRLGIFM